MTRQIRVGDVLIGGGAPVVIQSMLNTKTTDVPGSLAQIRALKMLAVKLPVFLFRIWRQQGPLLRSVKRANCHWWLISTLIINWHSNVWITVLTR